MSMLRNLWKLWYSTTSTQEKKTCKINWTLLVGYHMQIKHARHKKKNISIDNSKRITQTQNHANYFRNLGIDSSAKENFKTRPTIVATQSKAKKM